MATILRDAVEAISFEAVSGTVGEVRKQMKSSDEARAVALVLPHSDERTAKALVDAIMQLAPMIVRSVADRDRTVFDRLVEALVPTVPAPEHLVAEAKMVADARRAVIETADWLTAADLSKMAGFSAGNPSTQPNKWKREGRIFAVSQNGIDYYPAYALDPDTYRPRSEVAPVLQVLKSNRDDWDVAIWFASVNSFLGGATPKDQLGIAPERVLAAARDEVAGVQHG